MVGSPQRNVSIGPGVGHREPGYVPGFAVTMRLIAELKVKSRAEIRPTYRVITPTACASFEKWRRRESNPRNIPLDSLS
jgi:hypothetical protein